MSSDLLEHTISDLCELIKIALDSRKIDKAQELLDTLKLLILDVD